MLVDILESNCGQEVLRSCLRLREPQVLAARDSPILMEFRGLNLQDADDEKIKSEIKRWAKAVAAAAATAHYY
uniref:Uncharacterized protein n=1 Tax=Kalanchoe fedtschenkoi TaxID=63787 RepID=A0A7N0UZB8_KALFE